MMLAWCRPWWEQPVLVCSWLVCCRRRECTDWDSGCCPLVIISSVVHRVHGIHGNGALQHQHPVHQTSAYIWIFPSRHNIDRKYNITITVNNIFKTMFSSSPCVVRSALTVACVISWEWSNQGLGFSIFTASHTVTVTLSDTPGGWPQPSK